MPSSLASKRWNASYSRQPRPLMPSRSADAWARCLSIDHSSSRVKSLASGVFDHAFLSRRRHATTAPKKMRRR
eukprot:5772815-Prymnesium_polylepis.1